MANKHPLSNNMDKYLHSLLRQNFFNSSMDTKIKQNSFKNEWNYSQEQFFKKIAFLTKWFIVSKSELNASSGVFTAIEVMQNLTFQSKAFV